VKLDESQFKDTQKLVRQLLKDSTHLYDLPIASYEVPVYELWHEAIEVVNDVFDLGLNETKIRVLEQSLWQVIQKKKL
jgi:hypothetical protein